MGSHDWLPPKNWGPGPPERQDKVDAICTVPLDCGTPITRRLYPFGAAFVMSTVSSRGSLHSFQISLTHTDASLLSGGWLADFMCYLDVLTKISVYKRSTIMGFILIKTHCKTFHFD